MPCALVAPCFCCLAGAVKSIPMRSSIVGDVGGLVSREVVVNPTVVGPLKRARAAQREVVVGLCDVEFAEQLVRACEEARSCVRVP